MKKYFGLIFLLLFLFSLWTAAMDEAAAAPLPEQVLRLRVIAASDAPEDQARKLRIRDLVLEELSPLLEDCDSLPEAASAAAARLAHLEARSEALLREEGAPADVTARLGRETCPLREYDTFALPAGRYDTLTLTIGEGRGHNWWCVVFPPLCLSAAGDETEEGWAVFSPGETRLLTSENRVIRFRVLELWQKLRAWLGH